MQDAAERQNPQFTESVTSDHSHVLNITTPLFQCGRLWIVAGIVPNNKGVIGAVMKKSQHANHAIMEIHNIHAYQLQCAWYLYTKIPVKKRIGSERL